MFCVWVVGIKHGDDDDDDDDGGDGGGDDVDNVDDRGGTCFVCGSNMEYLLSHTCSEHCPRPMDSLSQHQFQFHQNFV